MSFPIRPRSEALATMIVLVVLIAGCSKEDAPTAPSTSVARVGSTFTYYRYQTDMEGVRLDGSEDTVTNVVMAAGVTFAGKGNVSIAGAGLDTMTIVRYDPAGDIEINQSWLKRLKPAGNGWLTLPVWSKTTRDETLVDSTLDLGGGASGKYTVTLKVSHAGSENITVGSETLATEKIVLEVKTITPITADLHLLDVDIYTWWYSQKLGFFVRETTLSTRTDPGGNVSGSGTFRTLTTYHLQ